MAETPYKVRFYTDVDGVQPAKDFMVSLDYQMRAKIISMIQLLQDNGKDLRESYSKQLVRWDI